MSNLKKCIIILTIILIIIIGILIYVLYQNRGKVIHNIDEIGDNTSYELKTDLQEVSIRNNFYIVRECVNKFYTYYTAILGIEEDYYGADESIIKEAQQQNAVAIYNMLDSEYTTQKGITKENIMSKIEKVNRATVNITDMYVSEKTPNMSVYIVKGTLRDNKTFAVSQFQMIVKLDSSNRTFSILLEDYLDKKYSGLKEGDSIDIQVGENIEKNDNNTYIFKSISDETYCRDLFYKFKEEILYNPELAFSNLNEEYRQKRFETLDKFKEYAQNNMGKYAKIQPQQYQRSVSGDIVQYICTDQNGNYYIFRENSIMDYELILDTYTLDLPEFTEIYDNSTEQNQILLNIQKVFEAINLGDYKYVYNKLDDTFKENYFRTELDFENYIKSQWPKEISVSYGEYQKNGEIYIYDIQMSNKTENRTLSKQIVMQLKEERDFVMSFNVE